MGPAAAPEVIVCGSDDELAERAARVFIRAARDSVAGHGRFRVALAGGSTPRAVYTRLGDGALSREVPWHCTEVFWGDERLVPPEDPASNYRMIRETLLSRVPIAPEHVHRFHTELTPPAAIARQYEDELRASFRLAPGAWPAFDLVLLGMGEDGHTASLFPGSPALHEQERLAVAVYAAHLHTYRVTLTLPVFNAARLVVFLVQGDSKAKTLRHVLGPQRQPEKWPAQAVQPYPGRLIWLVDAHAARFL
jgi:6-phosphogluconolactonase